LNCFESRIKMTTKVLNIEGMTCGHCKMAVERALQGLAGVTEAEVDLEAGSATVRYDESSVGVGDFASAVEEAGYSVV
jgi:copper chaperone